MKDKKKITTNAHGTHDRNEKKGHTSHPHGTGHDKRESHTKKKGR